MTKKDQERLEKFTLAAMQGLAARNTIDTYLVSGVAVQIAKQTIKEIDKQSND